MQCARRQQRDEKGLRHHGCHLRGGGRCGLRLLRSYAPSCAVFRVEHLEHLEHKMLFRAQKCPSFHAFLVFQVEHDENQKTQFGLGTPAQHCPTHSTWPSARPSRLRMEECHQRMPTRGRPTADAVTRQLANRWVGLARKHQGLSLRALGQEGAICARPAHDQWMNSPSSGQHTATIRL
jgi:hypothetical protein